MALDQLRGPAAELLGGACIELTDLEVSGLAFHEGDDAGLAVAEHGIGFPMPDAGAVVGGGGSFPDGSLACQSSTTVVGAVSLSPLLGGLPQVRVQGSPSPLVVPDVSVDGLMADLQPAFKCHSAGDLLGAPVLLLQQSLGQVPVLVRESAISP